MSKIQKCPNLFQVYLGIFPKFFSFFYDGSPNKEIYFNFEKLRPPPSFFEASKLKFGFLTPPPSPPPY